MRKVEHGVAGMTYDDLVKLPDDGLRHEIIDGMHVASPSPIPRHQDASRHIQFALYRQIELPRLGKVYNAPVDLELDETDIVVPDIVVVLTKSRDIITDSHLKGIPDLVVEILSPSTSGRDRGIKRALYERTGIGEYWVVDARGCYVDRYVLGPDGRYGEPERHQDHVAFADASVDLRDVWSRLDS